MSAACCWIYTHIYYFFIVFPSTPASTAHLFFTFTENTIVGYVACSMRLSIVCLAGKTLIGNCTTNLFGALLGPAAPLPLWLPARDPASSSVRRQLQVFAVLSVPQQILCPATLPWFTTTVGTVDETNTYNDWLETTKKKRPNPRHGPTVMELCRTKFHLSGNCNCNNFSLLKTCQLQNILYIIKLFSCSQRFPGVNMNVLKMPTYIVYSLFKRFWWNSAWPRSRLLITN